MITRRNVLKAISALPFVGGIASRAIADDGITSWCAHSSWLYPDYSRVTEYVFREQIAYWKTHPDSRLQCLVLKVGGQYEMMYVDQGRVFRDVNRVNTGIVLGRDGTPLERIPFLFADNAVNDPLLDLTNVRELRREFPDGRQIAEMEFPYEEYYGMPPMLDLAQANSRQSRLTKFKNECISNPKYSEYVARGLWT